MAARRTLRTWDIEDARCNFQRIPGSAMASLQLYDPALLAGSPLNQEFHRKERILLEAALDVQNVRAAKRQCRISFWRSGEIGS